MSTVLLLLLGFGLIGLSVAENPDEEDDNGMLSDFFSTSDENDDPEEPDFSNEDSDTEESPFSPETDDPFDLGYDEPEETSENPFESEFPEEPDSVPEAREDESSPFDERSLSDADAESSAGPDEPPVDPADDDSSASGITESHPLSSLTDSSPSDDSPEESSASEPDVEEASTDASSSHSKSTSLPPELQGFSSQTPSTLEEKRLHSVSEVRTLCETVIALLHDGELDRAFAKLERHWPFPPDEMDTLQQELEHTRATVRDRYGAPLDYRFVHTEDAANALLRLSYLERFERHGLRWALTFYKGDGEWTLNDVTFDDDIDDLLD